MLWLLSLTEEEARSLDGARTTLAGRRPEVPTSLLWHDVQRACAELRLSPEVVRSVADHARGHTQEAVGLEFGVTQQALSKRTHTTATSIVNFLNGAVVKAA